MAGSGPGQRESLVCVQRASGHSVVCMSVWVVVETRL